MATIARSGARETDDRTPALVSRIVRDQSAVEPIWTALENLLNFGHLTTSWAWTSAWLDAYGDDLDHWFVIAEILGKPVGIALVTRGRKQKRGPLPLRTLHIGTAGERRGETVRVEYNRLLVQPDRRDEFLNMLLRTTCGRPWSTDLLELNGFAPEELTQAARSTELWQERNCYAALLDQSITTIDTFDGDTRRKLRNNFKRFTAQFGDIKTEWIESSIRAEEVLAELISLHQSRWNAAGQAGAFASPRFRDFHKRIVTSLLPANRLVLARVTAGDQLVGIFYGFVENGVIYHYQWGLTQFDDNKLSPGFVTGYKVMEEAVSRGYTELNWLAGESRYKRELSNTTRSLIWAAYPRSPWMHAVNGLISAKRSLRGRS